MGVGLVAKAVLCKSSGMMTARTGQPRLHSEKSVHFHSIHTHQSCGAWGTGEPTGGRGEVGGGGEVHLLRTNVIEGGGDGARVEPALDSMRAKWAVAWAIAASTVDIGRGRPGSGKEEV